MKTIREILKSPDIETACIVSAKPGKEAMRPILKPMALREGNLRTLYQHDVRRVIINYTYVGGYSDSKIREIVKKENSYYLK